MTRTRCGASSAPALPSCGATAPSRSGPLGEDAAERHQGAELACFVSCSRSGLTSKVHHGVNSLSFVRRLLTSPGQRGDYTCAEALTAGLQPLFVVGDKAYNTDKLRTRWLVHGIGGRIPPKSNRLVQHLYNKALYRTRHMVENSYCRLKTHRRLSLRLDKTETSFRAFACFAAALLNLQLEIKLCPQTLSAK